MFKHKRSVWSLYCCASGLCVCVSESVLGVSCILLLHVMTIDRMPLPFLTIVRTTRPVRGVGFVLRSYAVVSCARSIYGVRVLCCLRRVVVVMGILYGMVKDCTFYNRVFKLWIQWKHFIHQNKHIWGCLNNGTVLSFSSSIYSIAIAKFELHVNYGKKSSRVLDYATDNLTISY